MNTGTASTLHYDPNQNAIIDSSDGSILPLDVLGSAVTSLPEHIQAQIQCKQDEDYARSLAEGPERSSRPKLLGAEYAPENEDVESRLPQSTRGGGYTSPTHQSTASRAGKSLEEEYIEMHSLYPGAEEAAGEDDHAGDPDWTLARALQGLEFEIVQDTLHDPISDDFNEKEYRASSCKRQLMTASTFICLVQVCGSIMLHIPLYVVSNKSVSEIDWCSGRDGSR